MEHLICYDDNKRDDDVDDDDDDDVYSDVTLLAICVTSIFKVLSFSTIVSQ